MVSAAGDDDSRALTDHCLPIGGCTDQISFNAGVDHADPAASHLDARAVAGDHVTGTGRRSTDNRARIGR